MILTTVLAFLSAIAIGCKSPAVSNTMAARHFAPDTTRASRDSLLESYRAQGDKMLEIERIEQYLRVSFSDIYSAAFWTAVYRDKGVSQVLLSVEFWDWMYAGYWAYAVFRSDDRYWYAGWQNDRRLKENNCQHTWELGEQILVDYRSMDSSAVEKLLRHVDSTYDPLDRHEPLRCGKLEGEHGFAFVTVSYCGRSNTYLVIGAQIPIPPRTDLDHRFDLLFDYQDRLCGDTAHSE